MAEGSPDYTKLVQILGRDVDGNLVAVRVDPYGRIILLPYGTMAVSGSVDVGNMPGDYLTEGGDVAIPGDVSVDQNAVERTSQGENGAGLHTILVDSLGRMIMVPYGFDGVYHRVLKVDEDGRMISVMKGQADVTWELRGWWKFVASEEAAVKDYSGYGNNGVVYSGASEEGTYIDGVIGQALSFDGDNDYISIPHHASIDLSLPFTLEAWVKRETQTDVIGDIINKVINYQLKIESDGTVQVGYRDAGENWRTLDSSFDLIISTWYHIVITYEASGADTVMQMYINGTLDNSGTRAGQPQSWGDVLTLGAYAVGTERFCGLIDEPRIYGRALSSDEVSWRYANTNPATGKPTRMVAVDNEGRMLVNIQDLPYKDTVLFYDYVNDHAAGVVKIEGDPVPEGKLWVITNVVCRCMLDDSGATSLYIRRADDYIMISELLRTALYDTLTFSGQVYLKAGDLLACWFGAVDLNKSCQVYVNGYSLNV